MSEESKVANEHIIQFKAMLESCEIEFDHFEDVDGDSIELHNGTRFIFDSHGMLLSIEY